MIINISNMAVSTFDELFQKIILLLLYVIVFLFNLISISVINPTIIIANVCIVTQMCKS